jgi:hypothetical protein
VKFFQNIQTYIENWHIWKFAVKNLLRRIEGAYEVCASELLETRDKADRATCRVIVKDELQKWRKLLKIGTIVLLSMLKYCAKFKKN